MDWAYLFLRFDGRIGRKQFWIGSSIIIVVSISYELLFGFLDKRWLTGIADLVLLYPDYAVVFKRAHDREMAIWIPVLSLILSVLIILSVLMDIVVILGLDGPYDDPTPLYLTTTLPLLAVALYLIVDLGFLRGVRGPNCYGPDPLERQT
jgi:uncharacterized membrane protein YhaH (DUF805 family)